MSLKNTVKNTGLQKMSDTFNTYFTNKIIICKNTLVCFSTWILWQNKLKK